MGTLDPCVDAADRTSGVSLIGVVLLVGGILGVEEPPWILNGVGAKAPMVSRSTISELCPLAPMAVEEALIGEVGSAGPELEEVWVAVVREVELLGVLFLVAEMTRLTFGGVE